MHAPVDLLGFVVKKQFFSLNHTFRALTYLQNWEKNLDFDNYYVTPYFVRKDNERRLDVS